MTPRRARWLSQRMSFSERFAAAKKSVCAWRDRLVETGGALIHDVIPMAAALVIGFALAAALFGPVGPEWLTFDYWRAGKDTTSYSEIFRNLVLSAVAVIGLFLLLIIIEHRKPMASIFYE